jgi:hypothetical protein
MTQTSDKRWTVDNTRLLGRNLFCVLCNILKTKTRLGQQVLATYLSALAATYLSAFAATYLSIATRSHNNQCAWFDLSRMLRVGQSERVKE